MIKRIFSILSIALMGIASLAMDLPVKEVNGKPYYYYIVKKGDTVYSLLSRFGITRSQLIASNPSAAGILKTGETLYFSVEEFGDGKPYVIEREPEVQPMPEGRIDHHVKKGETLYGISKKYGVSQDLIVELNPKVRSGVKTGMIIQIPVAVTDQQESGDVDNIDNEATGGETESEQTQMPVSPTDTDQTETLDDSGEEVEEEIVPSREATVAVVLPFMLESETPSKQALLYTDFYKGMLLAADTLSNRGDSVKIFAFDTMGDINRLKQLLKDDAVKNSSVIIAPDDERQLEAISSAVGGTETKVINVFNVKDSLYLTQNAMVQTNVPHRVMYAKALAAIDKLYPGFMPVIVRNESGRSDKAEFIAYIKDAYRNRGVEALEIVYDGALLNAQVESLPDDGGKYLIIPSSGSLSDFNKMVHAIKTVRESSGDKRTIELFGYPDWTAFRGDAESMLHAVGATVFSRFYYDADGFDTRCLNDAFVRWYGEDMLEGVPNHGVLGFDVGNLVIRNLRENNGFFNPMVGDYVGVQSSFEFERADDNPAAGYFNDQVYILRFYPGTKVERLHF